MGERLSRCTTILMMDHKTAVKIDRNDMPGTMGNLLARILKTSSEMRPGLIQGLHPSHTKILEMNFLKYLFTWLHRVLVGACRI